MLTKLQEADEEEDDGLPQLPTHKLLAPVQRARFKAYFDAPLQGTADNPLLSLALAKRESETSPTAKSRFAWAVSLDRFRSLAWEGVELPVRSVTRAHFIRFKDALRTLPSKIGLLLVSIMTIAIPTGPELSTDLRPIDLARLRGVEASRPTNTLLLMSQ